ncbi:hypothetical protein E4U59_007875 [Claviceps monticola]|nr:hypothetical protein E4U59_007875 [Claviceps monticola]
MRHSDVTSALLLLNVFVSEANKLDPGEPPELLEALGPLTPLEEWLIARVHTRMQVMTYRGAQYKYRGHIISFPKNVPTMSQGTTLDRAVVDVSVKDFSPGLSYVAVSRVKTLDGIMFDAPFDHQSICGRVIPERDSRRLDAVRRQAHHLPADVDEVD